MHARHTETSISPQDSDNGNEVQEHSGITLLLGCTFAAMHLTHPAQPLGHRIMLSACR
jgi:hypothetical protein